MVLNSIPAPPRSQSTIRSFFQPRSVSGTDSPAASASSTSQPVISHTPLRGASSSSIKNEIQQSDKNFFLPPRASITPIKPHHVQPLRRINSLLLPIKYRDSFYNRLLEPHPESKVSFSRVVLWTDDDAEPKVIGGLVCRIDPSSALSSTCDVYVQSIALLSPYRSKGIANALLQDVLNAIKEQSEHINVASLYAHVWTENQEALKWYSGRGFVREGGVINAYYQRLKPDTAWLLRRKIMPSDLADPVHLQSTRSDPSIPVLRSPPPLVHTSSFQDRRPDKEWNDLPDDVLRGHGLLKTPPDTSSAYASRDTSRSSSRSAIREKPGKKKRLYPAAAFGDSGGN